MEERTSKQQGFYCDACELEHNNSADKVVLNNVSICKYTYTKMNADLKLTKPDCKSNNISKLQKLKAHIGTPDKAGLNARIDFISLAIISDLYNELKQDQLFDVYNLGIRDHDTCFEMFDGQKVICGIVERSKWQYLLKLKLKENLDPTVFKYFMDTYNENERKRKIDLGLYEEQQLNLNI